MKVPDICGACLVRVRGCLRYFEEFSIHIMEDDFLILYLYSEFWICLMDMHITVRDKCQNNLGNW